MAEGTLRRVDASSDPDYCTGVLSVCVLRRELEEFAAKVQQIVRQEFQNYTVNSQGSVNSQGTDGQSSGRLLKLRRIINTEVVPFDMDESEEHEWMQRPYYSHFYAGPAKGMLPEELTAIGTPKSKHSKHPQLFHRPEMPGERSAKKKGDGIQGGSRRHSPNSSGLMKGSPSSVGSPPKSRAISEESFEQMGPDGRQIEETPPAPRGFRAKFVDFEALGCVAHAGEEPDDDRHDAKPRCEVDQRMAVSSQTLEGKTQASPDSRRKQPASPILSSSPRMLREGSSRDWELNDAAESFPAVGSTVGGSFAVNVSSAGNKLMVPAVGEEDLRIVARSTSGNLSGTGQLSQLSRLNLRMDQSIPRPERMKSPPAPPDENLPVFNSYIRRQSKSYHNDLIVAPRRSIRDKRPQALTSDVDEVAPAEANTSFRDAETNRSKQFSPKSTYQSSRPQLSFTPEFEEAQTEIPVQEGRPCCRRCWACCPSSVTAVVDNEFFDYCIAVLVLANAVLVGIVADWAISHVGEEEPVAFRVAEASFCCIFVLELAMRLYSSGCEFFGQTCWRWNVFDMFVVGCQVLSEILNLCRVSWHVKSSSAHLRILRCLRVVRVIRLVRIVHIVRELRTMVASVAATMKSLCWTVVLICLMIYMIGVHITQVIVEYAESNPGILKKGEPLEAFYGSLGRTVLSLYQAMTGGVDWDNLVVPLIEHISPVSGFIFSLYIGFAVLAVMNVITGLFVESALTNTKSEDDVEMVAQMRELFMSVDFAETGQITWDQFRRQLSSPGMGNYFKAIDLDISEARGLFKLLDLDESGSISADEFVMGCLRLRGPAKAIDLATLMYDNRRTNLRWSRVFEGLQRSLEYLIDAATFQPASPFDETMT